jgi:hypothetical protein
LCIEEFQIISGVDLAPNLEPVGMLEIKGFDLGEKIPKVRDHFYPFVYSVFVDPTQNSAQGSISFDFNSDPRTNSS